MLKTYKIIDLNVFLINSNSNRKKIICFSMIYILNVFVGIDKAIIVVYQAIVLKNEKFKYRKTS